MSEVDELVMWVEEMREKYFGIDGEKIFDNVAPTDKLSGSYMHPDLIRKVIKLVFYTYSHAGSNLPHLSLSDPANSEIILTDNVTGKITYMIVLLQHD